MKTSWPTIFLLVAARGRDGLGTQISIGANDWCTQARNRFTGLVTRVVADGVMAQVELQAGPYRVVSLISAEATRELGLEPGALAVAAIKATNVVIERP